MRLSYTTKRKLLGFTFLIPFLLGFFMFFAGIILAVLGIIGAVTNNSVWVLAGLGITIISVFIPIIYANKLNKTISKE